MAARRLVYLGLPPVCPRQYSVLSTAQTCHEALYHVQRYPPVEVVQRRIQRFGQFGDLLRCQHGAAPFRLFLVEQALFLFGCFGFCDHILSLFFTHALKLREV